MNDLHAGEESKQIIDLGWENSWGPVPDIVRKCVREKHPTMEHNVGGRGVIYDVYCPICHYRYRVDSSD